MNASELKPKDTLLIIGVSPMAFTSKMDIVVKEVFPEKNYIHYSYKGKRKLYGRSLDKLEYHDLVFHNTVPPFMRDSDAPAKDNGNGFMVNGFAGNALINLVGEVSHEEARKFILENNKNPKLNLGYIVYNEKLLFPEEDIYHAVATRMKEKEEVWS